MRRPVLLILLLTFVALLVAVLVPPCDYAEYTRATGVTTDSLRWCWLGSLTETAPEPKLMNTVFPSLSGESLHVWRREGEVEVWRQLNPPVFWLELVLIVSTGGLLALVFHTRSRRPASEPMVAAPAPPAVDAGLSIEELQGVPGWDIIYCAKPEGSLPNGTAASRILSKWRMEIANTLVATRRGALVVDLQDVVMSAPAGLEQLWDLAVHRRYVCWVVVTDAQRQLAELAAKAIRARLASTRDEALDAMDHWARLSGWSRT